MRMEKLVQKLMRVTGELNSALTELKSTRDELEAMKVQLREKDEREEKYLRIIRVLQAKFPIGEIDLNAGKFSPPRNKRSQD